MRERIENRPEQHDVIANATIGIINALGRGDQGRKDARELGKFMLTQAYSIYLDTLLPDIKPEELISKINDYISKLDLDNIELKKLFIYMIVFQSKIGIKPVQRIRSQAEIFNQVSSELDRY